MSKIIKIQLEWHYKPIDSIADDYYIEGNGFIISFSRGKATTEIDPLVTEFDDNLSDFLTNLIKNELIFYQLREFQPYTLSGPSQIDILENGKMIHHLKAKSIIGSPPIIEKPTLRQYDKNGNEIIDPEIIKKEKKDRVFKEQLQNHKDSKIVQFMLNQYKLSIENSQKSLVYLYDIREVLSKEVGGKKTTIKKLNILESNWNRLGEIANDLPVIEGRHTGKKIHELKNADPKIILEARIIARTLIEKYLDYLDKCKT